MELRNISIQGSNNKPILLDIFYQDNNVPKPVVIFSHGFKGFKDWGHFNFLAKRFAQEGFVFVKFNFSHNGYTIGDPEQCTDLEAFGHNNYSKELQDLQNVIDWACTFPAENNIDFSKIFLLGHSRGGGISIIKAAEEKRIKKIATWASVSDFVNRNKKKTIETWQKDGVVYTTNARTKQQLPLYYQFYEDLIANRTRFNIIRSVKELNIPFLIVHGTEDEAVPVMEAEQLRRAAGHGELVLIERANHTFGVSHPFTASVLPGNTELVVFKTIEFYKS